MYLQLTPWSSVLLEKLTVVQLVKKSSPFHRTPGSLLFTRTLYVNLADGLTLYFIKTLFNIILTNKTVIVVTLQIFILEVLGSNLTWDSGYPDRFLWFSSVPPERSQNWTTSFQILSGLLFTNHLTIRRYIV
jgi:hypothetical protein